MSPKSDLEIAQACAQGDPEAIAHVEADHFPEVRRALGRMRLPADEVSEVMQELRADMFVASAEHAPRIATYEGRGSLGSWLRVCATRAALKRKHRARREVALDEDALLEERAPGDDPELALIKETYRAEFKAAFSEALASLTDRDRTVLRFRMVDGLTIDDIGAFYGVHRATADRWAARAEDALVTATRRALLQRPRVGAAECESLMRLLRSQLDATIRRRLAAID